MNKDGAIRALALFDASYKISSSELALASGLLPEEIEALVDFGVFVPLESSQEAADFPAFCLIMARRAHRLRADFELNPAGLALALTYLQRIEELEARLHELDCAKIG